MERKLLSLPSFFVLLLIAGIAFLAVPVVDVQASAPGAPTAEVVNPTGSVAATEAAPITTGGKADVVVIKMTLPVKVTGVNGVEAGPGFGKEDLTVSVTDTSTGAEFPQYQLPAAKVSVTPLAMGAKVPGEGTMTAPAASQWFVVNVEVPANGTGAITVAVTGRSVFQHLTDTHPYAEAANQPTAGNVVYYNTYNPLPTVAVTAQDSANANAFEATFTIADNADFTAAPTFALTSIVVEGGTAKTLGPVVEGANKRTYTVKAYIEPTAGVPHLVIGVKAGAVTDARGGMNVEVPATLKADGTVTDANAKRVNVDTIVPMVMITATETLADSTKVKGKDNVVTSIAVTFTIQETPAATATVPNPPAATILVSEITSTGTGTSATPADPLDYGTTAATQDITVTGGTLSGFSLVPAQYHAIYTATIEPQKEAEEVVISVKADAVKDQAGNGTAAVSETVDTGYEPTAPPEADPEYGTVVAYPDGKGIKVSLHVPAKSFVVLARSDTLAHNGISGLTRVTDSTVGITATTEIIDIKDDVWEDLSSFMGIGPGGAIDLLKAGAVDKDLVISEIMWGSDAGLGAGATIGDRANSQWIELYNTNQTKAITGEVELRFTKSGTGVGVTDVRLLDKFTNFGLTQSNQYWAIPDTDGGAYGQGGRTSSSGTNIGTPLRLISMERKIDFVKVETTTNDRAKQLEGVPAGDLAGSWQASKDPQGANLRGRRLGTPGAKPFVTVSTTGISGSVVFNEIANRSNKKFDWIELYNPGTADVKINNWALSKVTAIDKDEELFKFESDENIVVPSKGFLLVVNDDPSETALAAGKNIDNPRSKANGLPTEFYINEKLDIPKEKFLLILRTELKLNSHEKIVDIAGNLGDLDLNHGPSATEVWPLRAWKRIKADDLGEDDSNTWRRDRGKNLYHADAWKSDGGYTGLGIDRNPESDEGPTSGTPGFDNGAIKDKVKDLTARDPVVISEIMFGRGGTSNRPNPQWIELFNPSKTQAVKLLNWRLEIQNITIDPEENLNVDSNYTLILPDKLIQPNQTLLIVSASAREATRDRFPSDRIINVWSTRKLRETVEMTSARDAILSSVAFYIKLSDPDKTLVDHVGNIERPRDTPEWDLPGGNLDDGGRASMIRREGTFGDGTEEDSWISAAVVESGEKVSINEVYYGDATDLGTPGYRQGGPVPVQLSSFYSKRNAAGAVVITWSTESELDNAGFNILRSTSQTGEFVRINAQLIPGAGTTGEKSAYTWTDTSAKPNVLYFYQIEDVSLAGDHRTLRTTRLRGYIGAAGKATTTWGDLKSRE